MALIDTYPDLKIVPMVNEDVVPDEGYSYWLGGWGGAHITHITNGANNKYLDEERIYFDIDTDDVREQISDYLFDDNPHWSDSYIAEQTEKEMTKIEWEKVIAVRITLPY